MADLLREISLPVAVAIGACVGSFVTSVAFRLPRKLSIWQVGRFCAACERSSPAQCAISLHVINGVWGHCSNCGAPLSSRYLLAELSLACVALYLYLGYPLTDAIARFVLCAALVCVSFVDLDWRLIPDAISIPGIPCGLLAGTYTISGVSGRSSLLGMGAGAFILLMLGRVTVGFVGKKGWD